MMKLLFFHSLLICVCLTHTKEIIIKNGYGIDALSSLSDGNYFDLLVFTQQWPATACKEWKKHDPSHSCAMPPKADTWTIHGIWPTKFGTMGPAFCNRTWLFDPEQIKPIENELSQVWVNIFGGTSFYSLWAHEWSKHGTCAALLEKFNSELKYFSMGLNWIRQYSMFETLQSNNIVPSNTKQYSVADIYNVIKNKLGVDPVIECKKEDGESYISEIRICFTKDLKPADCDGIVSYERLKLNGVSILTNCKKSNNVVYPHYTQSSNIYVQLYHFVSWLQRFTL